MIPDETAETQITLPETEQKKEKTIEDIAKEQFKGQRVYSDLFKFSIDYIARRLNCKDNMTKVYDLVRIEAQTNFVPTAEMVEYFYKSNNKDVPIELDVAARRARQRVMGENGGSRRYRDYTRPKPETEQKKEHETKIVEINDVDTKILSIEDEPQVKEPEKTVVPIKKKLPEMIDSTNEQETKNTIKIICMPKIEKKEKPQAQQNKREIKPTSLEHITKPYDVSYSLLHKMISDKRKEYNAPEGYMPFFALEAVVKHLIKDGKYETVEQIEEDLIEAEVMMKGEMTTSFNNKERCPERVYDCITTLLYDDDMEKFPHLKHFEFYQPTNSYNLGQVLLFGKYAGVILKKLPDNGMLVKFSDGEKLQYVEKTLPSLVKLKNVKQDKE